MLIAQQLQAQSYEESALTFSRTKLSGSARIQGIGGAGTALGGDYSAARLNPAGLGMYNRSEITLSPGFTTQTTSSFYNPSLTGGNSSEEVTNRLNIPGFSVVFNMPKETGKYLGGSIGISFTRINDFNNTTVYEGTNTETSIIDYFIDDAWGYTTAQFDEGDYQYNRPTGLAYFNYLIGPATLLDPSAPDTEYFTDVTSIPFQQEQIKTRGAMNEWNISYGGNYNDIVFFGASAGISTLRYKSDKYYTESFADDPYLNDLSLDESLDIKGTGVNLKLGVIIRPVHFFQVGLSYSTPTLYQLSEKYEAYMNTSWKNFDYYGDGSVVLGQEGAGTDIVTSEYNLTTPSHFSAGAAFIFKYGFVTGDVELTNPGGARYSSDIDGISYGPENDGIKAAYQRTVNYRGGVELRYDIFRLRGGYARQGNAYADELNADNSATSITGGVGIRTKTFFIDFALVQTKYDDQYSPYSFISGLPNPTVDLKSKTTNGIFTVGFVF